MEVLGYLHLVCANETLTVKTLRCAICELLQEGFSRGSGRIEAMQDTIVVMMP